MEQLLKLTEKNDGYFQDSLTFQPVCTIKCDFNVWIFWTIFDTDYMDKVSHQYVPTSVSSIHHFVWNILDTNYMDKGSHQYVSTGVSLPMKNVQMSLDKPCKDTVFLLCVFLNVVLKHTPEK